MFSEDIKQLNSEHTGDFCVSSLHDFEVRALDESSEKDVINLIRKNLSSFKGQDIENGLDENALLIDTILKNYKKYGSCFYIVKDTLTNEVIAGAGLCSFASLPLEESIGEIRGLVLDEQYKGQGVGTVLMKLCLEKAKKFGYKQVYLQTTSQMEYAQNLFKRFGFKPIVDSSSQNDSINKLKIPHYFVLENLQ